MSRDAPPALREEIGYSKQTAAASLEDVRRIARRLRPEALDDLGVASALTSLADRMAAASGLAIERRIDREIPRLDSEVELVLYRIAQESLTNALRHGRPTSVTLRLERAAGCVQLTVADDGIGFDVAANERRNGGIRGMRERALLIGARLALASEPQDGTRVVLEVPAEHDQQ
jgi:two-component system sensor histidine kinase UhpB